MEIVYRAVFMFVFLWVITRVVGRATLGELSTFELLLYVTMGDLVQQGVTQQDYSVTSAVLAVGVFALLTVAISYVNWRWPRARPVIEGIPIIVVSDGEPVLDSMRKERLSIDDLMTAAREEGIKRFSDVELAVFESNGRISFFTRSSDDSSGAPDPAPTGT
ncbi:MAG: DUF421 domain-containing protein [Geodermatophilaceae bacterium]|nr:DUF421 domain-containing protein [Geodermatophilaceae bacterium]